MQASQATRPAPGAALWPRLSLRRPALQVAHECQSSMQPVWSDRPALATRRSAAAAAAERRRTCTGASRREGGTSRPGHSTSVEEMRDVEADPRYRRYGCLAHASCRVCTLNGKRQLQLPPAGWTFRRCTPSRPGRPLFGRLPPARRRSTLPRQRCTLLPRTMRWVREQAGWNMSSSSTCEQERRSRHPVWPSRLTDRILPPPSSFALHGSPTGGGLPDAPAAHGLGAGAAATGGRAAGGAWRRGRRCRRRCRGSGGGSARN